MYKEFSNIYDLLTFDIDYKKYANNIFSILKDRGIEEGYILEMACGTGNLTKELAKKDYEILAFDNSMDMLNIAFPKLIDEESVNLVYGDIFTFRPVGKSYDAIVTLLDVINYFTDEEDLVKIFQTAYRGLRKDGVFIFDLNSENKLKKVLANNTYVYEYEDVFYSWENEMEGDLIHFYLNFFIENEDGSYDRIEERQTERYYPIETIKSLLEDVGFHSITYIDEDTGGRITEKTQRILFSAVK